MGREVPGIARKTAAPANGLGSVLGACLHPSGAVLRAHEECHLGTEAQTSSSTLSGQDRKGPDAKRCQTTDHRRHGKKARSRGREGAEVTEVLYDRETGAEQDSVRGAFSRGGVVDVDAVDANEARSPLDE